MTAMTLETLEFSSRFQVERLYENNWSEVNTPTCRQPLLGWRKVYFSAARSAVGVGIFGNFEVTC